MPIHDHNEPLINTGDVENILWDFYGIKAGIHGLPGECDLNFKIQSDKGETFVLKISRPGTDPEFLVFQQKLLRHLNRSPEGIRVPVLIRNKNHKEISNFTDISGRTRAVRLMSWIPGRLYCDIKPQSDSLRRRLGSTCGTLTRALLGFDHQKAHRTFDWDVAQSLWTLGHRKLFSKKQLELVSYFQERFETLQEGYRQLRRSVVHNDANDHNIIVSESLEEPLVEAVVDFGDAIYTQIINDLSIACAYGIMDQNDPLAAARSIVRGYCETMPLQEEELAYLYDCIGMRLVITVTKAAINRVSEPNNSYLQVSVIPAWKLLEKWKDISEDFAHFSFREACGFPAHPQEMDFHKWTGSLNISLEKLFPSRKTNKSLNIDLSVSSRFLGHLSEFSDFDLFEFKIDRLQEKHPDKIISGGYLEPRFVYTTDAYRKNGNDKSESRTIHLGIDFWLPAGTPVHAPLKGIVEVAVNDEGDKEYGGLIILKHRVKDLVFYSLYGHLSVKSATARSKGETVEAGEYLAELGNYPENGNWPSHLHFELMHSMLDFKSDFPGVAYQSEIDIWKSICPDPNLLFKIPTLSPKTIVTNASLFDFRQAHFGKGLSLSYKEPLQIVRGMGSYLIDQFGAPYLDTVNNVAHVGHEHPEVVRAGQEQMALLNTNSRYLHENLKMLTEELLSTFPKELCVVHFVNSGSEANDLALRMAKTATGNSDVLVSEMGYHGNTNACIDISSYKFDGPGGKGCPEHTHVFPLPDLFRGKFRGADSGRQYASEVGQLILELQNKGRQPAAVIVEPIISCGGQIELPRGFLSEVYKLTRKAGGLCISDEVQVGCGRLGEAFWGFELHDVVPDIVTIGKPLGNGHPMAAVVCTRQVAESFDNGMEYFNTFGANPVSCAIATKVLQCVKNERLQDNAREIGRYLTSELKKLSLEHSILRDIRGKGLFLGVELTDEQLNPLAGQTQYLVNRMKDKGILMSLDGRDHNVIKIKPPLTFSKENVDELIHTMKSVLSENYMSNKYF